jgi:hypothetical protein
MFDGKPVTFDALCVQQDEVCELPRGACVFAGNAFTAIQAVESAEGGKSFWGVQYHPEFDLSQIAAIFSRGAERMVAAGFVTSVADAKGVAADLHVAAPRPSAQGSGVALRDRCRHPRSAASPAGTFELAARKGADKARSVTVMVCAET